MWSSLRKKVASILDRRAAVDDIDSMIPDPAAAAYVGGGDAETYKAVGREQVEWLRDWGGLKEDEDVLEVGCGIGRIAAPLTRYLRKGSYRGFDIVPHGIEWCQQRIAARYPNFGFSLADIYNKTYNPNGKLRASDFSFPFPDRSFDFVFLTSVFTHMLADDVDHYIAEISRVLRPGGRCYCTAYLIDDEAREAMDKSQSHRIFRPVDGDRAWTDNPAEPESAIAYPVKHLFDAFDRAGMDVRRVVRGQWWKNASAQDTFVAHRR